MAQAQPRKFKDQESLEELVKAKAYFGANNLLVNPPIKRAAYSDRMAWVLASMSHLAYDRFEEGGKAKALLLKKLDGGGFNWISGFNSPETDTQAFLVVKEDKSYAVLAFRGTEVSKLTDIKTDAKATMVSLIEGRVHKGFINAYKSVQEEIEKNVAKLDGIPLYITGHSLGAALATVATQFLEGHPVFRDQIAACYTYGSPRVGNDQFDRDFKSAIYRVVNTTDVVTVVPLLAMGYIHIGDVRFLLRTKGEFRRGIPIFGRLLFFFGAGLLKLFGPWVQDHAIVEYRMKLEAIAQDRNLDLYFSGPPEKI